jgi:hypothetical protein
MIQTHLDSGPTKMPDTFDENHPDSTVCLLVKRAIVLADSYEETLLQGDEVDFRIKLWRDAIDTCKVDSQSMSRTFI